MQKNTHFTQVMLVFKHVILKNKTSRETTHVITQWFQHLHPLWTGSSTAGAINNYEKLLDVVADGLIYAATLFKRVCTLVYR